MADEIAVLSVRLRSLEDKVYGKGAVPLNNQDVKISESLVSVNNRMENGLAGRERIKSVLKKINEIERYLDPAIGEKMTLETTTKLDIIFSEDNHIRNMVSQLETLHSLKPVFNSEHIKATPDHFKKLTPLEKIQVRQEERASELSDEVKDLFSSYNEIIASVIKQFAVWDAVLTKIEIASQPKKKS